MKIKQTLLTLFFLSIILNAQTGLAADDDTKKINAATEKLMSNPSEKNIDDYLSTMKKRATYHGLNKNYEAQADDIRSILYFLRKDKASKDYAKYYKKLNETYALLGFQNTQNNRLEIAKTLFLEKKYFASAYEFMELANEDYHRETCYEYLGAISYIFKNSKAALIYYKKGLELNPKDYCFLFNIAKVYREIGEKENAEEYFEATINATDDVQILNSIISIYESELKINPTNEKTYEILGLAYQKKKEYKKTYALFKRATDIAPNDIFLQYYLGNLLYDMTEYRSAVQIYDRIIQDNPYESQIRIARAKCLGKIGDINGAIKDYQVVLAMYPDSKQAQFGLYTLLWGKKSFSETIKTFYPLNKNFVPTAQFYNSLAGIVYQKGMVPDAIAIYKKSIALAPKAEWAYLRLYDIYELENKKVEAVQIAKLAYKNIPTSAEVQKIYKSANKSTTTLKSSSAISYMANREYEKAIKIYQQVEPKDASIYESIAICYKSMKNYKTAIDYYSKALKLDPVNSDYYYNTALLYLDLNSKKTAENFLKKALELDNKNLKARKLLAHIKQQEIDVKLNKAYELFEKKDYANTLVELNRAEGLYPNNPEVFYYKALTYKAMGDDKNAYVFFDKTLDVDRSYYVSHFYMAQILERQGKERSALEEYEKFLGADVKDQNLLKQAQDKVIKLGKKYY